MKVPLVAAFEQDHRFADFPSLEIQSLLGEDLITLSNFDRWPIELNDEIYANGIHPRRKLEVFTAHGACEFALQGAGIAIVDALTALDFAERGLCVKRLKTEIDFEIVLMRPKHRRETKLAAKIRHSIQDAALRTQSTVASAFE